MTENPRQARRIAYLESHPHALQLEALGDQVERLTEAVKALDPQFQDAPKYQAMSEAFQQIKAAIPI